MQRTTKDDTDIRWMEAYTPYPIEELHEIYSRSSIRCPDRLYWRSHRRGNCLEHAVLHRGHRLPAQRRRPAAV